MEDERPTVHVFVALEIRPGWFTAPALVSLELAEELHQKGYCVVGPDPEDMDAVAEYDRVKRWLGVKRKWFEQE